MLVWLTLVMVPPRLAALLPLVLAKQWLALAMAALSGTLSVVCLQHLASPSVLRACGWRLLYAVVLLHGALCVASGLGDARGTVLRPMWLLLLLTNVRTHVCRVTCILLSRCMCPCPSRWRWSS